MPLVRCSDQARESLRDHYSKDSNGGNSIDPAQLMISIIDKLDEIFKETIIFGLTSIKDLNLLAYDSYKTDWFVTFIARSESEIYVEYLLPLEKRPWPFAKVKGEAKSVNDGIK